jgi:hypothetical protein
LLTWLRHDIYNPEVPRWNPLGLSIYAYKNERQTGKVDLFQGWVSVEGVNEGEYVGCILYSYMKREEWNLLTLPKKGGEEKRENSGGG